MKEHRNTLIGLALVGLVLAGLYHLYLLERRHQESLEEAGRRMPDLESSLLDDDQAPDLEVQLYFYDPEAPVSGGPDMLVAEARLIFRSEDRMGVARQIVQELIHGPRGGAFPILPEQSRLRQIYLLEDGTAVVDLSREAAQLAAGGIVAELSALLAITRSLTENVAGIRQVRVLVDGQPQSTFAGHVSIRQPFM